MAARRKVRYPQLDISAVVYRLSPGTLFIVVAPGTARKGNIAMSPNQLERVRRICLGFPETFEKISHGAPTFFAKKKVFVTFADNHHQDGRVAVWVPADPGAQEMLIAANSETYFKPPYVGIRGWVGINLGQIDDQELIFHITNGWYLVAPKRLAASFKQNGRG
jgi:hypothetical protein